MSDDMNRTPENPEDCEAQKREARSADTWHTPPIIDGLVATLEEMEKVDRTTADLAIYGPVSADDDVTFLARLAKVMRQTGLDHTELSTVAGAYGKSLRELLPIAEELIALFAVIAQPILPPVSIAMYLLDEQRTAEQEVTDPEPITFDPVTRPGGIGDIARQVNDQSRGVFDRLGIGRERRERRLLGLQSDAVRRLRPRHQIDADQADRLARRTADFREQPLTDFDPELFDPTTGRETARRRAHLRLVNEDPHALPGFDPFRAYTKRMLGHGMALTALMALGNFQETTAGTTDDTPEQNPHEPFDPAS